MMRLEWNRGAFRALRTDPAVLADVRARAQRIAATAGEGYVVGSGITGGRGRARASVRTGTRAAVVDNSRNNTLIRAIDAGR